jgi:hypothetical protein
MGWICENGDFSTDGPLGIPNLYFLTVTMMKTGSVFNNQAGSNIDTK